MGQLKVSGDPRRPADVRPYTPPPITEPTGDVTMLGGMIFGGIALFFKSRLSAWLSLFVCLSSAANLKSGQADLKGTVTAFSFAVMSIIMTYIPAPQPFQKPTGSVSTPL